MDQCSIYNKVSFFGRAFPVPMYLSMPAVGIDISDYAIKYVSFKRSKGEPILETYGKIDLPLEAVERGEIKDAQTLVKLLSRIRDEHRFEFVHLALPEEHAYLFQIDLPVGKKEEVEQMLEFHLKENVPIGAEEAVFDYNVIHETKREYTLNVSVYPMSIASQYIDVLEQAGFKLLSVEIEGQATSRTLVGKDDTAPKLIVDIGRNNASLAIAKDKEVVFTANLDTGGDYFTRSISRELNLSFQEAEKLKREHGFRDTPEDKIIFECLLPIVSKFADSIQKHLMYWHMHMNSGGDENQEVNRVILVGGNANIAGLAEYLEATLEVSVGVGDVWKNIFSYERYIPDIHASTSLEYATAVGAALRSIARSG